MVNTQPGTPTTRSLRRNSDPAMDPANEHSHKHLHHSEFAISHNHHAEPMYAHTGESIVPDQRQVHLHDDLDHSHQQVLTHDGGRADSVSDAEKGNHERSAGVAVLDPESDELEAKESHVKKWYRKLKPLVHLGIFLLFTGWWIAGLVLHRKDKNWIIPFLVWLAITLRLIFFYVPSSIISDPIKLIWQKVAVEQVYNRIPPRLRTPAGAVVVIAVFLVGAFASPEFADNTRANRAVSLFGLLVTIGIFWLTSHNRRAVNWRPVLGGMLTQFIIALFVLRTGVGYSIFKFIADRARDLLGFAKDGVIFLTSVDAANVGWFFMGVLPPIIFFVSLVQVAYYIGLLQWFIGKFGRLIFWMLQVSGAEAVVAAATPFIGQGESALLVRPFVPLMTRAEIHQVLTCGFATISGSVLIAYISLGLSPEALVSSCIMSIPASLAMSKLRYPETEQTLTGDRLIIPDDDEHKASNALHAFSNGAWLGIKIAGSIIASILCILAAVGLIDGLLTWWGRYLSINNLTLNLIFGYLFYPIAFLLGVPRDGDLLRVSKLIAEKVIINEYAAFSLMKSPEYATAMSARSKLIATYALCGFGNIGSLGIQIGIMGQIAPGRAGDVARLAFSALVTGVVSTLTSAAVAGLVITERAAMATG